MEGGLPEVVVMRYAVVEVVDMEAMFEYAEEILAVLLSCWAGIVVVGLIVLARVVDEKRD